MTAARWNDTAIDIGRFDVVGFDAASALYFIEHVGLAANSRKQHRASDSIEVIHMRPPLEREGDSRTPQTWGAVPLTVDEENRLNMFIDERILEHEAADLRTFRQYIVRPHARPKTELDGTILYWLYSCAGFVVEAYRAVGLEITATKDESLPLVALKTLLNAYPHIVGHESLRAQFGIPGDGPWRVLLAGHVLHALNRDEAEIRQIPYVPKEGDEVFP